MKNLNALVSDVVKKEEGENFISDVEGLKWSNFNKELFSLDVFKNLDSESRWNLLSEVKSMSREELVSVFQNNKEHYLGYYDKLQKTSFLVAANIYDALLSYESRLDNKWYAKKVDDQLEGLLLDNPGIEDRFPAIEKAMLSQADSVGFEEEPEMNKLENIEKSFDDMSLDEKFMDILLMNIDDKEKENKIEESFKKEFNLKSRSRQKLYNHLWFEKPVAKKIKGCNLKLITLLLDRKAINFKWNLCDDAEIKKELDSHVCDEAETKDNNNNNESSSLFWKTPKIQKPKVLWTIDLGNDTKSRFSKKWLGDSGDNKIKDEEIKQDETLDPIKELVWKEFSVGEFLSRSNLSYEDIEEAIESWDLVPWRLLSENGDKAFFVVWCEDKWHGNTALINVSVLKRNMKNDLKEDCVYAIRLTDVNKNLREWDTIQTNFVKWFIVEDFVAYIEKYNKPHANSIGENATIIHKK